MNATASAPGNSSPASTGPAQHLSNGMRTGYGALGVVAIAFAALLLFSAFRTGYFASFVLYLFAVVALLALGTSDIVAAMSPHEAPSSLRTLRLVLGVLILVFAFVALVDIRFAFVVIWVFVGLGLLFQGLFLIGGVGASQQIEGNLRGLGIALGVIDIALAFVVILIPALALYLVLFLIAIALVAASVYLFTIASTGVKRPLPRLRVDVPGFPPSIGGGMTPPPSAKP